MVEGRARIRSFASRVLGTGEDFAKLRLGVYVVTEDVSRGRIVSSWCAFVTNNLQFVIEAPHILAPTSRDTLVSLLDSAEELGCVRAVVCIDRNRKYLKELVRAFRYYGFELQLPGASQEFDLRGFPDDEFALMATQVAESDSA
eukprot:Plantae.Rhodophyta-Purpureofilum_apyrenoidigerum.ctg20780.p1 GENE.Plantae.Rhodophyta-Purpureofilum_apyrenoidigerum.ctg20780~~Plantae.Rhodophyta-Purpureofilum_apyrenoidigerum.ctg20780.p1  ORF type:complete len:144 (+),score=23.49 Plantae.Rhodophyta-Purpureofilum_apyrenoidigerum.ctg20780:639-1070(+)